MSEVGDKPKKKERHGLSKTPEYRIWTNMRRRCLDPRRPDYCWYGAKGVTVCKRWQHFECFYSDMGRRPKGHTLDRIDRRKGYTPSNCRWATVAEQNRNKGDTIVVRWKGESRPLVEVTREESVPHALVRDRIRKQGWSVEDAIKLPLS